MLKKLRNSFALLSTILTGTVLLVACVFAYSYSKSKVATAHNITFEYQCQSLSVLLAGTNRIDHKQIQRMEKDGKMYVYFYDNGQLLPIAGTDSAEFRNGLIVQALSTLQYAENDLPISVNLRYSQPLNYGFEIRYDEIGYQGKFISVPTSQQGWYSFVILKSTTPMQTEISALKVRFVAIFFGGVFMLALISWGLAKRSIKPIEIAQQKQTEFIAAASHELKSPLALVSSSLEMIEMDKKNMDEYTGIIRAENRRMNRLVDDLLILAGSNTGKWQIKKSAVSLEEVLSSVYERFIPMTAQKRQILELHLPKSPLPIVQADEERLLQIIGIFMSNAMAHTPDKTVIELNANVNQRHVEISVVDHGVGIADEEKKKIFDSFYRQQEEHSDTAHFGLGLSIASTLAELHSGRVTISDTPNGGATFTLVLPLYTK